MGFLISLILFLVFDVGILFYLATSQFFSPYKVTGEVDVWNISVFIVLLSFAVGFIVSLLTYLAEKLLYCGRREYPRPMRALRFGAMATLSLIAGLFLHVFHFFNGVIMLVLFFIVIIGFVLVG